MAVRFVRAVSTVHIFSRAQNLAKELSKRCPNVEVINVPVGCSGELEKVQEAKVLISDPDIVACFLPKLSQLAWLQLTWAGIDELIKYVTPEQRSSLTITRFGGVFGPAMSQYVIGSIISWERDFRKMWKDQVNHEWDATWKSEFSYRTMPQLSIAILGLGDIGRTVAKACKALNMTVWGVVRSEKREKESFVDHYMTVSQLSEALRSCDYVCNVLPSTPATKHLLSGSILESGKDKKPVFINIGRGDVISESSLVNALNRGWLSGAILDVFEVEPLPKESELWRMSQVVITPHIAALTFSSEVADLFVENLSLYEAGEKLKFVVDVERGY